MILNEFLRNVKKYGKYILLISGCIAITVAPLIIGINICYILNSNQFLTGCFILFLSITLSVLIGMPLGLALDEYFTNYIE